MQSQKAVFSYFTSKQILHFGFAEQYVKTSAIFVLEITYIFISNEL